MSWFRQNKDTQGIDPNMQAVQQNAPQDMQATQPAFNANVQQGQPMQPMQVMQPMQPMQPMQQNQTAQQPQPVQNPNLTQQQVINTAPAQPAQTNPVQNIQNKQDPIASPDNNRADSEYLAAIRKYQEMVEAQAKKIDAISSELNSVKEKANMGATYAEAEKQNRQINAYMERLKEIPNINKSLIQPEIVSKGIFPGVVDSSGNIIPDYEQIARTQGLFINNTPTWVPPSDKNPGHFDKGPDVNSREYWLKHDFGITLNKEP